MTEAIALIINTVFSSEWKVSVFFFFSNKQNVIIDLIWTSLCRAPFFLFLNAFLSFFSGKYETSFFICARQSRTLKNPNEIKIASSFILISFFFFLYNNVIRSFFVIFSLNHFLFPRIFLWGKKKRTKTAEFFLCKNFWLNPITNQVK